MSLIDKTYFVKDINIPDSDYNDLTAYITRYEKEILQKLLGYELWVLVEAYDVTTSPQRIKDIVEGKEYTVGEYTCKWNGLANDDLISLIAYYVFFYWLQSRSTVTGNVGELKLQSENSENASIVQKLVFAWTKLEQLAQGVGYPYDSLYSFLSENESDYPEWVFTELDNINVWGI